MSGSHEGSLAGWHLDRRFSVALVLALTGQIATAVWFASKTDSRIGSLEERHLELSLETAENREFQIEQRVRVWDRVTAQDVALNAFRAELAGINAHLEYITRSLDRMTLLQDEDRRRNAEKD